MMKDETKNQWIWLIGTLSVTFIWTFGLLFIGEAFGVCMLVIIPMLSLAIFKRATSLFDIADEERERMRQDALKKIKKDFINALKTLQMMGYVTDLTDMSYKETEWTEIERATIEKAILLLMESIEKRKRQKPLRQMQPEEIRFLVEQKRRRKTDDTFLVLKEEKKKREQELSMLDELLKEESKHSETNNDVESAESAAIKIKKIDEELESLQKDELEYDDFKEEESFDDLEEEIKTLDEEIEEVENDEDYVEEDEYNEVLVKQGKIYEKQETETGFSPVEAKSLREVLGDAMLKLREVKDDESKS